MRSRLRRFARAKWRAGRLAFRRHVAGHRRALIATLLVLAGGGLLLATLSGRHSERTPGPSAARPAAASAPPGEPVAPPEKPLPSARPPQEAALRPPPALPPPGAKPAWLRFAAAAPPTGNPPLVAIVV